LSPSVSSSSSSLASIEESSQRITGGYVSDGLVVRVQDRKKGEVVNKLMCLLQLILLFCSSVSEFLYLHSSIEFSLTLNVVPKLWISVTCHSFWIPQFMHVWTVRFLQNDKLLVELRNCQVINDEIFSQPVCSN
jgi:hypothetical protein